MTSELKCLTCGTVLTGKRTKFCQQRCAAKWHNSQQVWSERLDRAKRNAIRKARYEADPEFWRNKARKWREDHPEQSWLIHLKQKELYWTSPWRKGVIAAKGRAKKRGLPFDLTFEWAEKRWTGFCELTQIPFAPRRNASLSLFSPSIDRIVANKGYTQDNCRFVLFGVNCLKHDGTDEAMYFVAEHLLKNRQKALPNNP